MIVINTSRMSYLVEGVAWAMVLRQEGPWQGHGLKDGLGILTRQSKGERGCVSWAEGEMGLIILFKYFLS